MGRILLAFRSFFVILFHGRLSQELLRDLGLSPSAPARPAAAPASVKAATEPAAPAARVSDGALQILSILQRDARLVDFIMEDITPYSDDQVGAAVRGLHDQAREALGRYVKLEPVIDGVEGTYTKATSNPALVKFIGNVPAGAPSGGTLRHKGWRAAAITLPAMNPKQDANVIAPAEIEIE